MKVFFGLLLVANIGFAAFQWLLPYAQLSERPSSIPAAEKLQLLSDSNAKPVSESEVIAEVEAETSAIEQAVAAIEAEVEAEQARLVNEDNSDKRICYTIGPIKDKTRAVDISGRYSSKKVKTSLKSSLEKEYQGVMVFIGGHKNREEALVTANALTEHGIKDHIIFSSPDRPNILSLGVFGLKRNAARLKSQVEAMKFRVETEARYRERTIYWLYGEQSSEADTVRMLEDDDFDIGISQTPTQCLPG